MGSPTQPRTVIRSSARIGTATSPAKSSNTSRAARSLSGRVRAAFQPRRITRSISDLSMGSEIAVGYPVYASWKRPILTIHGVKQYLGETSVQGDSMTDVRDKQRLILDPQESSFFAETNAVPSILEGDGAAATDALPVRSSDPKGVSVASSGPPSSSSSRAGRNEEPPFGKSEVGVKQSRSPDDKSSPQVAAEHVVECSAHGMEDDAQSIRQSPVAIAATEDNGSNPELPLEKSRDSNWQQNPSESDEVEPRPAAPATIVQTIPEDPTLTDADFPPPFLSPSTTPSPPDTSDPAALIYRDKFASLPDPHLFIRALTRVAPSRRTTADLYALAANTQAALKLWQDEYLQLDKHTAPLSAIPKRPATGGRQPLDPLEFEDLKEADLYDYTFDPKRVGFQDPFRQRTGRLDPGGRELRQRRARDVLDAAGASEYDDNDAGIVVGGRTLRDRTAAHSAGTPDPASRSRKRANSSGPDRDRPPPKKRGRQVGARAGIDFLHPRVREMRGQSVTQSVSTDDDDEGADGGWTFGNMSADGARSTSRGRKGRPPGSKNVARRSDAGVKKGPRKAALASSAAFGGADAD
ncbi:hypothetical protein LTR04_006296, partial [Oleoguttula sp. CCFEE 6159]